MRSRSKLDYAGVQQQIDQAPAGSTLALLRTIGELRIAKEAERGGVSLPMPAQEIDVADDRWRLEYREMLPVESWNAQLSLLTGFAAASLMIEAEVGILRTLPPAPEDAVRRLASYGAGAGDRLAEHDGPPRLHPLARPVAAGRRRHGRRLHRRCSGARGTPPSTGHLPEQTEHAALASPYAHVTAPLRRLVDRYGLEICAALCAGDGGPGVGARRHGRRAGGDARLRVGSRTPTRTPCSNLVEALTLRSRVGEPFEAVVLEVEHDDEREGTVMVREPAVEAPVTCTAPLPVGEDVTVTLAEADPATRKVRFTL